jgi:hypothetical protein
MYGKYWKCQVKKYFKHWLSRFWVTLKGGLIKKSYYDYSGTTIFVFTLQTEYWILAPDEMLFSNFTS